MNQSKRTDFDKPKTEFNKLILLLRVRIYLEILL